MNFSVSSGRKFSVSNLSILHVDWILLVSAVLISLSGLITMNSFVGDNYFFERQSIWLSISILVFFLASVVDWRFLRSTRVIFILFIFTCSILLFLFVAGSTFRGAQSWFDFGGFSFQPSDPAKLVLVILLSKYFSRRHVEIAHIRHVLVSGAYAFILFVLVLLQPDFGSAIIIASVWLGMILLSGISKKHLLGIIVAGALSFFLLWNFAFAPYQKQRILTFIHPLADVRGAGYNAFQSTIAVGSGQVLGKGVGYGTQSKLQFLPEYETDFIFAAFAEEWGFVGSLILLLLYGVLIWRVLRVAFRASGNFEMFFGLGLAVFFVAHIIIHIGMNLGLLPITGTTIPFMSYGGSHLLTEFLGLGMLVGMSRYSLATHRDAARENEIPGVQ